MRLIPREEKFFDLFEELAAKIDEAALLFLDMLRDYDNFTTRVVKLKELEHEADIITHRTYEKMHRTFLTPLDREDIHDLVNKMDSIIDMTEAAAIRMSLYKIGRPTPDLVEQAKLLCEATKRLKKIVRDMRDMKNAKAILDACVEINTIENAGDTIMRTAMARLFEQEKDPIELIKWKEILERFEETLDVCEDVSNIVEGIVLKNG